MWNVHKFFIVIINWREISSRDLRHFDSWSRSLLQEWLFKSPAPGSRGSVVYKALLSFPDWGKQIKEKLFSVSYLGTSLRKNTFHCLLTFQVLHPIGSTFEKVCGFLSTSSTNSWIFSSGARKERNWFYTFSAKVKFFCRPRLLKV